MFWLHEHRSECCITQKIVLFLSVSVSSILCFLLVKDSVDGLSESRTVEGGSDLHTLVTFYTVYLSKKSRDDILVGMVLLSHRLLAASIGFL